MTHVDRNIVQTQPAPTQSTQTPAGQPTTDRAAHLALLQKVYARRLVREGVPTPEAQEIAIAIANYDTQEIRPTRPQKELIGHYCSYISRCHLWRLELLLGRS